KPTSVTGSSFLRLDLTAPMKASSARLASALERSALAEIYSMSSVLFIRWIPLKIIMAKQDRGPGVALLKDSAPGCGLDAQRCKTPPPQNSRFLSARWLRRIKPSNASSVKQKQLKTRVFAWFAALQTLL